MFCTMKEYSELQTGCRVKSCLPKSYTTLRLALIKQCAVITDVKINRVLNISHNLVIVVWYNQKRTDR